MNNTSLTVRSATPEDIAEIVTLDHAVWDKKQHTSPYAIRSRIEHFSQGVPVCVHGGEIVGYGTMVRIDEYPNPLTWETVSAHGTITNHCPDGPILYGISLTGKPGTVKGISEAIFQYSFDLFESSSCKTFCLGSRIPGFSKWLRQNPDASAQDYVSQRGASGKPIDAELRLYQNIGFSIGDVLPNYFPDPESHDYGVLISCHK